ncbi:hypothetical protein R3I93_022300 [Phoxinus phoxinus]|uniref:Protein kinase domain-containing protein n=1 Tax=Phoxinus phoxinus TaxID=58324 RepID=A0AAN9C430_9TELE
MCDVTRATPVRKLRFSTLRALSDQLDPQEDWRSVMMDISGTSGEPRYSQLHIRRFEAAVLQGKSPTMEMLFDWGTTNCTVGDLVEILTRHQLFSAVSVLLPEDKTCHTKAAQREEQLRLSARPEVIKPVQQETRVMEPDSRTGPEENTWSSSEGFHTFSHRELTVITSDWDDRPLVDGGCRLGSGGFGVVFRGRMGDTYVAVKKLNPMDDGSLEDLKTQFNQEIQTLRSLKHEHLVELVGFSSDGQHMCLVYSFMPHGSLLDRAGVFGRLVSSLLAEQMLDQRRIGSRSAVPAPEQPHPSRRQEMEMKDEIEDDEVSLQDFIDSKMEGWQMEEVENMYDVASQCLCEKKNRRPAITQVLSELEDLHLKHSQSSG